VNDWQLIENCLEKNLRSALVIEKLEWIDSDMIWAL